MDGDLYEIWLAIASIRSTAQLRGEYTMEDLTRLEDLGEQLSRIVEHELRAMTNYAHRVPA